LLVGSFFLGGDAFGGKEEGGRYYLASHGRYTEVSRGVFAYSRIHGYTALTGWGIAMVAALAGHQLRKDTKKDDETQIAA
jgi:hypothetical protein